ncbi:polynucleotide kinase-phosphatase [Glycomyces terrestris]|uniref:Polynucleotide kinase-phosphatase n=1 Tax=Glycomyces terrestris TaxID=2493553 RepID=A0A426UUY7_9ACTN|nr:polynucleotide kinase-phosphatase [Glycomyces terrestris]RRR98156.1 polynucleotide kinase-phosphatase [Glycomyces terrestris]
MTDDAPVVSVPELSLVLLVGVSGSGKSTFAARHFKPTQVVSSDYCRGLVADDETDQSATPEAFALLNHIVGTRLRLGRLTVVDATNVQAHARAQLVDLAKRHNVLVDAIVLDVEPETAVERNRARADRDFGEAVVRRHHRDLKRGLKRMAKEGFRRVHRLEGAARIEAARVVTEKSWNDRTEETGPFDLIGDVHGCRAELEALLGELGWEIARDAQGRAAGAAHPEGRTAVFVGDLVDRGPDTPGVLRLVMGMVEAGNALCVQGNHEHKLVKALDGRKVRVAHGLAESLEQLGAEDEAFRGRARAFMDGLRSHYLLDGGRLVVAHAGLKEEFHGRASGKVRSFALYGDTTGETDEYGLPVRLPWAEDYRGEAAVVYGHTPVLEPEWVNNTICLDTGCCFGGKLTALRYPERDLVAVKAEREWYAPARPLGPAVPDRDPATLDVTDVAGDRHLATGLVGTVKVTAEHAAAALEVMSRFAEDPRRLLYLPPTMAPVDASDADGYLEHPAQAFDQYRGRAERVVCQEKHMGSRAVALVCRDAGTARRRFGLDAAPWGALVTRTGRAFFQDEALTGALLDRVAAAAGAAGLWERLDTDWMLLDCELLPWSAKARDLIEDQFAGVAAAGLAALPAAAAVLEAAAARGLDVAALAERTASRHANIAKFAAAYQRYCWPTDGLDGVRLAPFQVLATEGRNRADHRHDEHLALADALVAADGSGLLLETRRRFVALGTADEAAAVQWWLDLCAAGGEGMVVKPVLEDRPRLQPGLKVRGREYLRIIYGADYTDPERLAGLRQRRLQHKRSQALREYALGVAGLDLVAQRAPLWQVHQYVFAVLALESEPVDPRL